MNSVVEFSNSLGVKTNCFWQTPHKAEVETDDDDILPLASFNHVVYDLTTHWSKINNANYNVKYLKDYISIH